MSDLPQLTRQIQARLGVTVDGTYGPATAAAILAALPAPAVATPAPIPPSGDIDSRTAGVFAKLDPKIVPNFRDFYRQANARLADRGLSYVAVQGTRTMAEQQALYNQGRTTPGQIVTKAKPGSSWHNFAVAVDFGVFRGGSYLDEHEPGLADKIHREIATALADECGLAWGGDWTSIKDFPHYQPASLPASPNDHYRELFQEKGSVL
ncbi:M15 family metallopeptidase [Luteolibacter sp. LG18]|uniref:M15 family metallopeptidase n=1 Tax=Luteolibacter sp. LG18 TaxID=2819286 RepID=UPI002B2A2F3D|nr:hypothetical protein llg_07160 [Luteolibacter sp. LG18]BCU79655.1 hypothetical protein llg_43700 [Luteolibacter sp. LG18]